MARTRAEAQKRLCGGPHFLRDDALLESLLPGVPRAPAGTRSQRVPPIPLPCLEECLTKAKADKARGNDRINLYVFHFLPPSSKEFILHLCNNVTHWSYAHLAMLYKRGDPQSALN